MEICNFWQLLKNENEKYRFVLLKTNSGEPKDVPPPPGLFR